VGCDLAKGPVHPKDVPAPHLADTVTVQEGSSAGGGGKERQTARTFHHVSC
jgi:hypothetical protein